MADAESMSMNVDYDVHFRQQQKESKKSEKNRTKLKSIPTTQENKFLNKVVIVTESTEGIGFSIAEQLAKEGAVVVITSCKKETIDRAVGRLEALELNVFGVFCNVGDAQQRKELIRSTVERYGKIDVIISNTAVNLCANTMMRTAEPILDKLWENNFKDHLLILKEAELHLKERSSIVFVSSFAPDSQHELMGVYDAAKAVVIGLTEALAKEFKNKPPYIRVNSVISGFGEKEHVIAGFKQKEEEKEQVSGLSKLFSKKQTKSPDMGTSTDVAERTLFLASDDARDISGETHVLPGWITSSRL
ncbi:hypothetical protein Syun_026889 [Stephania yunnanensis]|uniref:Dehydrogenase/reductase SDR family member 4 n=1 Tax=Stephania yunnanensis TaxID=152371 RepID=A0AAP0HKJ2_9MAGN